MKAKLYLETSVVRYYTARPSGDVISSARQQLTREWWDTKSLHFDLFISEVVIEEASIGDVSAAAARLEKIKDIETLPLTEEVREIARNLVEEMGIPENALTDIFHLAIASHYRMDYLLTLNCKHLANGHIIKQLNRIGNESGIHVPVICTPEELLEVN